VFGRWGFLGFFGGGGRESKSWYGKSEAELIMRVYFITPLGWLIPNPESLLMFLDVGGHVHIRPVDPLKVNPKGTIYEEALLELILM